MAIVSLQDRPLRRRRTSASQPKQPRAQMAGSGVKGLAVLRSTSAGTWDAHTLIQAPGSWAPLWPGRPTGGHHVRVRTAGHHRPSALTGCDTWPLGGMRAPNKGLRYPADPPTIEEIILVMRQAGPGPYADRIRGLIAVLWRAGLPISGALALTESDLDPKTGSVLVRVGKGGKRRTVGMDDWGWQHLGRWTEHRSQRPIGPLFCILAGPTRGRGWSATAARGERRRLAAQAGVRRRFAPHQLRHAHAIEMAHEGIPLPIIQRQLGHAQLGITSVYLQGIDTREIVDTVHHRRPPVIPASTGLRP